MKDVYSGNYKTLMTEMKDTCEEINTISMFILLKRFTEPGMNYSYIFPIKILMILNRNAKIAISAIYLPIR